jgi:hypothetical protein
MAEISARLTNSIRFDSGTVSFPAGEYTGDNLIAVEVAVPVSTTDMRVDVAVDVSDIIVAALGCTAGTLTVETNASNSDAAEVFTVSSTAPIVWKNTDVASNPFETDITALYITNASATVESVLKFYVLVDATP